MTSNQPGDAGTSADPFPSATPHPVAMPDDLPVADPASIADVEGVRPHFLHVSLSLHQEPMLIVNLA